MVMNYRLVDMMDAVELPQIDPAIGFNLKATQSK
jgi:hypothetical protein